MSPEPQNSQNRSNKDYFYQLTKNTPWDLVSADSHSVLWLDLITLCWPVIYLNSWFFLTLYLIYGHRRFGRKELFDFKCISLCLISYFNLQAIVTVSIDPQGWYLLTFWHIALCILYVVPTYLFISHYLMVEERETLLIKLILTSIPWSKTSLECL